MDNITPKKVYVPSGKHTVLYDSMQSGSIEWHVQPEARLTLIQIDQSSGPELIEGAINFYMGQGSIVDYHPILSGSGSHRLTITALIGVDAHLQIAGAYALGAQQHCSIKTRQKHEGASSKSALTFNGVAGGQAVFNYQGIIIISEDAVKADAYQENKTILLTDTASALSIPSLEVHTNDVQCAHGSAVGQLQEDQLLYAQSRGLSAQTAHRLLFTSFFQQTLNAMENNDARNDMVKQLVAKAMMQKEIV